jgi:hypothetical protein
MENVAKMVTLLQWLSVQRQARWVRMVEYEGFKIQSAPHHQTIRDKWRLRIVISFEDHRGIRSRESSPEVLYATEHEANIHGTTCGPCLLNG